MPEKTVGSLPVLGPTESWRNSVFPRPAIGFPHTPGGESSTPRHELAGSLYQSIPEPEQISLPSTAKAAATPFVIGPQVSAAARTLAGRASPPVTMTMVVKPKSSFRPMPRGCFGLINQPPRLVQDT